MLTPPLQWLLGTLLGLVANGPFCSQERAAAAVCAQPMSPQLSSWAITGMPERLNFCRGKRQHEGAVAAALPT
jgi:hypothetical protein